MKLSILTLIFISLIPFKNKLLGTWETRPSEKGNITRVIFNKDNTHEVFINKKPFLNGEYHLKGNIMTLKENGCGGSEGVYKLIFFSGTDSLRFQLISDTCTNRKTGMQRIVLGRVK
ncbi:MAG TPA: hypothetical protein VGD17_13890 [Chitinophagaceae bacterium]